MEYGTEVLSARAGARKTQEELADAAGILKATLVDIENNRIGIDEATRDRLIAALTSGAQSDQSA